MKNFDNLFAAWMAVWAVFFVYEMFVSSRLDRLRKDLDRLKEQLHQK